LALPPPQKLAPKPYAADPKQGWDAGSDYWCWRAVIVPGCIDRLCKRRKRAEAESNGKQGSLHGVALLEQTSGRHPEETICSAPCQLLIKSF